MIKILLPFTAGLLTVLLVSSCTKSKDGRDTKWTASSVKIAQDKLDLDKLPTEDAIIVDPPQAPPPINRTSPARVKIDLEVLELVKPLTPGVDYTFWTFNGTVPGPMIRVREGDYVDFTLLNHPDNKVPHNIDLHAVTGPGGGAEASFTAPGHKSTFSFRVLNPGLYIYHCATAPVGMHVANGMYGLILVEPKEGLPKVDREFYIVQGEFYTKGKFGARGLQSFDMDKAIREQPEYVVFNGSMGAIAGDNALQANVNETIRLFVGNGGPNLISSFHVIGEIFDRVYIEGGTAINNNVQTTLVPAGGAAMMEFYADVPANLTIVDHSLFRAFNKGALGAIKITGETNPRIYTGKTMDGVYLPEGQAIEQGSMAQKDAAPPKNFDERMLAGEIVYKANCMACHQVNGQGLPGIFPPVAASDYLMADKERAIRTVKHGLEGAITVNGEVYNSVMPALGLSDDDIASVITYIMNSFGNKGSDVTPEEVRRVK